MAKRPAASNIPGCRRMYVKTVLEKMTQHSLTSRRALNAKRPITALYKVRYVHPKTGVVLENSFTDKRRPKDKAKWVMGRMQFLYDNEWVFREEIPEEREYRRVYESTREFFMHKLKRSMRDINKSWKEQSRVIVGENEFEDIKDCCDKVRAHFDKQVERYGYKCPITHIEFTTIRKNEIIKHEKKKIVSNISPDRLFDYINYTKQNVLFTSLGWNLAKQNYSLKDMEKLFPGEFIERYKKIVMERFPNNKDGI